MKNEIKIEEMLSVGGNGSVRERSFPTKIYTLYLDDVIGAPCEYRDHMEVLESANEWDDVRIVISSPGGRLDAGLMLIDGIKACRAPVTAHIHDQCGSMATGIALACQNWMLGDFAYFFVHTASWGTWGKDSEVRSQVKFMDKRIEKFLHDMYDGFLEPETIDLVSKGQDLWIDAEELGQRLAAYQEYRQEKEGQGCGNPDCNECGVQEDEDEPMLSLKDVLKEAIEEVLTERDKKAKIAQQKAEKKPTAKLKKALEQSEAIKIKQEEWEEQFK